jgi:hypothetical protein
LGMAPTPDLSLPQKSQLFFTNKYHYHRVIIYPSAY